jgi:hypothetical protein
MSKAGSQPLELSPITSSTVISSSLACECYPRVDVTEICKHSSLLRYGQKYCRKKFHITGNRKKLAKDKTVQPILIIEMAVGKFRWDGHLISNGVFQIFFFFKFFFAVRFVKKAFDSDFLYFFPFLKKIWQLALKQRLLDIKLPRHGVCNTASCLFLIWFISFNYR